MTVVEGPDPASEIMKDQKDIPVPIPMNVMMTEVGGDPDHQIETREDLDHVHKL